MEKWKHLHIKTYTAEEVAENQFKVINEVSSSTTSYDENGKQQLDFDVDKVVELGKAAYVSQRTNCTGKATVLGLMCNIIFSYNKQ